MKNSKIFSAAAILATIFAFNACDDSQSVEAPEPSGNLVSHPIEVNIDGTKSGQTDVAELADKVITVTASGAESKAIKVSDIIAKANNISDADLESYLAKYKCEYESGDDGFKPSNKGERCAPVSCSLSNKSYINVDTFGVFYDDDAPMTNARTHHCPSRRCVPTLETRVPPHSAAPHSCLSVSRTLSSQQAPPPRWRCRACCVRGIQIRQSRYRFEQISVRLQKRRQRQTAFGNRRIMRSIELRRSGVTVPDSRKSGHQRRKRYQCLLRS